MLAMFGFISSNKKTVMGWPNPPGTVRWIDLFCVETTTSNLAIVYLGLAPTSLDSVIMFGAFFFLVV